MSNFCPNGIPPCIILVLIIYSYFSYVVLYCIFFLTCPVRKCIYITVYHVLIAMLVWSFFATMLVQHAPIPHEYCLTQNDHQKLIRYPQDEINDILRKTVNMRRLEIYTCTDMGQIRYCRDCHVIKPDRSHHCSTCRRCILKMDHHCPWVGNCVGYSNYKQFFLTVFYALCSCTFCAGTTFEHIFILWKDITMEWTKISIAVGLLIFGISGMLVLVLFLYHMSLLCRNTTTLEDSRDVCFIQDDLTFNVGKWNNFSQVFGTNICVWFIPVSSEQGNGCEFPVRHEYTGD